MGQSPEIQTDEKYEVVPVHDYPKLILQTADLINAQWPRSQMARVVTLQASNEKLPCSLIATKSGKKIVVGHVKITPIPSDKKACFIESVVVAYCLRGQGIGSLLMDRAEDYCRDKGIETIFLSTYEKQSFYSRLGYDICEPINIFGNRSFVRNSTTKKTYMKKCLTST